jgi:hypothetical protein
MMWAALMIERTQRAPIFFLALIIERMQLFAALMIERTQRAALEIESGAGLGYYGFKRSCPFHIPHTALVATLDTYDL